MLTMLSRYIKGMPAVRRGPGSEDDIASIVNEDEEANPFA